MKHRRLFAIMTLPTGNAELSESFAAGHPDAELIRWCAALIELEDEWRQRLKVDEDAEYSAEYHSIRDAIGDTPAKTDDGNRAKLAAALAFYEPNTPTGSLVDDILWDAVRALALPKPAVHGGAVSGALGRAARTR